MASFNVRELKSQATSLAEWSKGEIKIVSAKANWKAYSQGLRTHKRRKSEPAYTLNTYPYQSSQWYSFNFGWNKGEIK